MIKDEEKELAILRKIVKKYQHTALLIHDEKDRWGWRSLRLKEALHTACKEAKIQSPLEA